MTDHLVPVPKVFRYINQFQPNMYAEKPSLYRCVCASLAMIMELVAPGEWIPEELEHTLYVQWAGPDVPTDTTGIDIEANNTVIPWLQAQKIPYVDLQPLVDTENETLLRQVIERMNLMGIPQLIAVRDESKLYDVAGHKLHSWADQGVGHAFVRAGFSDSAGYGLYYEPAAAGFHQPVPISWDQSIHLAGVRNMVAILPRAMGQPPADFDWLNHTWPLTIAQPSIPTLQDAMSKLQTAIDQAEQLDIAMKAAVAQAQAELAKGGAV